MSRILFLMILFILTGCASTLPPPRNTENVGAIFNEYPHWYNAAKKTERQWGVPVSVQMAIIYYESSFKGDARPARKHLLGMIPWKHISTAYGYAQALDGTWEDYLAQRGSFFAARNKFESATDFIGWYSNQARHTLGIPAQDSYHLYLAYHEGLRGFERRTYLKKPWLMRVAKKVASKSDLFQNQLACYEGGVPPENVPATFPMNDFESLPSPIFYSNDVDDTEEKNV